MTNFQVITKDAETLANYFEYKGACPSRELEDSPCKYSGTGSCVKCFVEWLNKESEEKKDAE